MILISDNFSSYYNEGVVVFAQPPTRRIVNIHIEEDDFYEGPTYKGNFFLSIPHCLFRIHYVKNRKGGYSPRSLWFAFTTKKYKKLFSPPLPNIDNGLLVCIPLPTGPFKTIELMGEAIIKKFWHTKFDNSMADTYDEYVSDESFLADHRKWARKTKKKPTWMPTGRSLQEWDGDRTDFFGKAYAKNKQLDCDEDEGY